MFRAGPLVDSQKVQTFRRLKKILLSIAQAAGATPGLSLALQDFFEVLKALVPRPGRHLGKVWRDEGHHPVFQHYMVVS